MANKTEFYWEGKSNDGAYEVRSNKNFSTKEECYNDMRNAVLDKMKWNTEYREDFEGENITASLFKPYENDDNCIGYKVDFYPHKIIHESYSGIYTYEIKEEIPFIKLFEKTWKEPIDTFREFNDTLHNIHANLWVTDCDDNFDLWAEWFDKNNMTNIEDTSVSCDICFPRNIKWSKEKEDYISSQLNAEPYDFEGTKDVFWRIDALCVEELEWLKNTLTKINDNLTPIVCTKEELIRCYKHIISGCMKNASNELEEILKRNCAL